MILEKAAKISSKGQITLPKPIRDALNTDTVRIVMDDGGIRIEPIPDLAGSLRRYAGPGGSSPDEEKGEAWELAVREKHTGR